MKHDNVDVRGSGDIAKLMALLKKNKIVVVLIYADWCGHCKVFKKEVWEPLSAVPNRKVPIAAINEAALKKTPFANAKIDGYPSVTVAGQDGRLAEFQGEAGEPTNALPNARDLNAMRRMVTTDPEEVANNMGASGPAAAPEQAEVDVAPSPPSLEEDEEPRSVQPTPAAEENLNAAGEAAVNTLYNESLPPANNGANTSLSKVVTNPPDVEDDLATEAAPLDSLGLTLQPSGPTAPAVSQEGGSLYYALLQAAREVAPAAALAGAAVYLDKRGSRRRGARRPHGRGRTARRKLRR
jgi:thiol-disulfide isomerase/thioredoxin